MADISITKYKTKVTKPTASPSNPGYPTSDPIDPVNPPASGAGGGGVNTFLQLTDTPALYTGQGAKAVSVKSDETGLEFIDFPTVTGGDEPAVKTTASADQTLPSGVLTILDYDSTLTNNATLIYSVGTDGRITVSDNGVFDITAGVVIEANAVTALESAFLGIFRNGNLIAISSINTTIAAGASSGLSCSTQIALLSGDIIDCRALVNSVGGVAPGLARRLGTLLGANATQVNSLAIVKCISNGQSFLQLSDTPSSYTGQVGLFPRVNSGETGLEFFNPLSLPLTGYTVGSNTALASTDTVLGAFGKVQGQINARVSGSGTLNYIPKYTASGTIGNSRFIDDGLYLRIPDFGITSLVNNTSRLLLSGGGTASNSTGGLIIIEGIDLGGVGLGGNIDIRPSVNKNVVISTSSSNLGIRTFTPTNPLDVNGTARIRTLSNATGDLVTASATGVLQKRTAAEVLGDIGGIGGTLTSGRIPFATGVNTLGDDSGLAWNNTLKVLSVTGLNSGVQTPLIVSAGGVATRVKINHPSNAGWGMYLGNILKWSVATFNASADLAFNNDALSRLSLFVHGGTNNMVIGNLAAVPSDSGFRLDVNGTLRSQGDFTLSDTRNIILGTTTGTKIGTATSQKLAFWNATPIVQPSGDILTALANLGLVASPTLGSSGTFTPTLIDNGGGYTYTLSSSHGFYLKIGNLVFINIKIQVTSTSGSQLGGLIVGDLPFTSLNDSNSISHLIVGKMTGTNWSTSLLDQLTCSVNVNTTTIGFSTLTSGVGNTAPSITNGAIWITGTYYSA